MKGNGKEKTEVLTVEENAHNMSIELPKLYAAWLEASCIEKNELVKVTFALAPSQPSTEASLSSGVLQ